MFLTFFVVLSQVPGYTVVSGPAITSYPTASPTPSPTAIGPGIVTSDTGEPTLAPSTTTVIAGQGDVVRQFVGVAIPTLLLITAAGGYISWWVAGRMLRPLSGIVKTAGRVDDSSLSSRIPVAGPTDEVREVAETINSMLDRLETAFASQTRFSANASHELRTPLAVTKTILQVELRSEHTPETTRALRRLLMTNEQMISITTSLLALASNTHDEITDTVDVRGLVATAITNAEPEIAARHLRLTLRMDPVKISGNAALLQQLVNNLIRNAVVHNLIGGDISVDLRRDASSATVLTVQNSGDRLSLDDVSILLEPFHRRKVRLTPERQGGGRGLGLSLVKAIADAHGANLTLMPRDLGGLSVTVRFR